MSKLDGILKEEVREIVKEELSRQSKGMFEDLVKSIESYKKITSLDSATRGSNAKEQG